MGPNRNYEANAPKTRLLAKAAEDRGALSGTSWPACRRAYGHARAAIPHEQVLPTQEARLVRSPIGVRVKAASPFPFEGGSALSDSLSRRHARREAADKSRDRPIRRDCESETPKSGLQNVNARGGNPYSGSPFSSCSASISLSSFSLRIRRSISSSCYRASTMPANVVVRMYRSEARVASARRQACADAKTIPQGSCFLAAGRGDAAAQFNLAVLAIPGWLTMAIRLKATARRR
jgi:hypothetical protein